MIDLIKDKKTWDDIVSAFDDADCYHTYDYHHLSKAEGEDPVLITFTHDEIKLALPLLIREIKGTNYMDATSVYGYAGPLSSNIPSFYNLSIFHRQLIALFRHHNIISVFSRLNPFIPRQDWILEGMGEIVSPGTVVNINVCLDDSLQRQQYNKRLKTYINKQERIFDIKKAESGEDILLFMEMYYNTMRKVNAKSKYFFPKSYFFDLMASENFKTEILLARCKETSQIISGAMFIKKNRIVQYHLSGSAENNLKLNPIKLLIEGMRRRASEEGYMYFNLGGGVGNKEDNLFQFKSGFSNDVRSFKLWRYVVDEEAYDKLVTSITKTHKNISREQMNEFFPSYRYPLKDSMYAVSMFDNPFLGNTFRETWLRHFNSGSGARNFTLFSELGFIKHPWLPLYYNTGATHTKGMSYCITHDSNASLKNTACLIYDVPAYFLDGEPSLPSNLGLYRNKQYPGYLIDLSKYSSLQEYMQATYSKSSRYKLNKYKKRLEQTFEITYTMYRGDISRDTYDSIFSDFRKLLEKRFADKQITNNNLQAKEWEFYYEVAYPMILEGSAALFVVYQKGQPIAITLNYLSESVLFDAITVFDIDYSKFHLGSVSVMALIEWCIANNIPSLDFSKGEFDYKKRWGSQEYYFEYHIFYNPRSVISRAKAWMVHSFFKVKNLLRDWRLNDSWHRLTYRLKSQNPISDSANYMLKESPEPVNLEPFSPLPHSDPDYKTLLPSVFEFLYLNHEVYRDIHVYRKKDSNSEFYIVGKESGQLIIKE